LSMKDALHGDNDQSAPTPPAVTALPARGGAAMLELTGHPFAAVVRQCRQGLWSALVSSLPL